MLARNSILLLSSTLLFAGVAFSSDSEVTQLTYQAVRKVVANFDAVLVKFDESYPSKSELDKQYKQFATDLRFTPSVLVAEVKVPYRGDTEKDEDVSEERRFAEKLNAAKTESLPVVVLFKRGQLDSPITFERKAEDGSDFTAKALRDFVRTSVPSVRITLESCIESLDELAAQFTAEKVTAEKRKALLKEAEAKAAKLTTEADKNSGKTYVKIMEKILDRGNLFISSERQRIDNMLGGKMSEQKKKQLQARLNILESFQSGTAAAATKQEL